MMHYKRAFATTAMALALMAGCQTAQTPESVNLSELLPQGAYTEIMAAYPEVSAVLVAESETGLPFGDRYLEIHGIEGPNAEELGEYVLAFLENPARKSEEEARIEAYKNLSPEAKLGDLVARMKSRYPDFDYEWTRAGEGNVKAVYRDNGLRVTGIPDDGNREEIGAAILNLQRQIDEGRQGEQE